MWRGHPSLLEPLHQQHRPLNCMEAKQGQAHRGSPILPPKSPSPGPWLQSPGLQLPILDLQDLLESTGIRASGQPRSHQVPGLGNKPGSSISEPALQVGIKGPKQRLPPSPPHPAPPPPPPPGHSGLRQQPEWEWLIQPTWPEVIAPRAPQEQQPPPSSTLHSHALPKPGSSWAQRELVEVLGQGSFLRPRRGCRNAAPGQPRLSFLRTFGGQPSSQAPSGNLTLLRL